MVFVSVSDDHAADFGFALNKVRKIWNNVVDSRPCCIGEPDTAIDNENVVLVFDTIKVLTDFAKSA